MRRKLFIAVIAVVVAVVGGSWFYIKVIEGDAPAKLALDSGSSSTKDDSTAADDGSTDGVWRASTDSVVGYRVKETLFGATAEAVGRTSQVDGSITVGGLSVTQGSFSVDMNSVSSDRPQRDGQFRGRIMNTSQFPTATFTLTSPISLSSVTQGDVVSATATGNLTLHGATRKVSFAVTAKRATGEIRVNGAIPIHFADYGINNPSGGPAQVGDDGTLEFTLVFTR